VIGEKIEGVRVKVRVRGGDVAYLRSGAKAGGWWRGCWKTQHSEEEAAVNLKKLGGTILFEEREGEEGRMSGGWVAAFWKGGGVTCA